MMPIRSFFIASALMLFGANAFISQSIAAEGVLLRPVNPVGSTIPGISTAMIVENGRLMFLSGHVPINGKGSPLPPDLEAQLELVFKNLEKTLEAANIDFSNLVRITIYVRGFEPDQLTVIRRTRDRFVDPANPPASALIGVAELFHPDVLVEVDAVAVLPPFAARSLSSSETY